MSTDTMGASIIGIYSETSTRERKTLRPEKIPVAPMLPAMAYDPKKLRAGLRAFLQSTGLRQFPLEKAAGIGAGTMRAFLNGRTQSMTAETYERLATAAAHKLGRAVAPAELRGEPASEPQIPVRSFVGAGEELVPIEGDEPLYWVKAPPGMEKAEATEVRGRSMMPLYHDKDVLFHRRIEADPSRWRGEVIVCQLKNGKRFVKLLENGSRRGRYNLVSVNPAYPAIEDQVLLWVGPIEWVRKRSR